MSDSVQSCDTPVGRLVWLFSTGIGSIPEGYVRGAWMVLLMAAAGWRMGMVAQHSGVGVSEPNCRRAILQAA
jgi:hypothetical protein